MAKRIITISREFGSGGRFIGEEVAKELGIAYYDKNIISQIAEKSGLSPEYIQENAELSPKRGLFAYAFAGRDITGKSVEDLVHEAQRKVILDLAEKEPCVIIGRNADYILKDRDDVLNVFIHGDMPEKIKRITRLYKVNEQEAVKMMADIDKRRGDVYKRQVDQMSKGIITDTYRPCFASLVCKKIRGRLRVYVHITVEGKAISKRRKDSRPRHYYGKGNIGCDKMCIRDRSRPCL